MKKTIVAVMAATLVAGFASETNAAPTTTTGFGIIPGQPATGANPYSGSGIPYDTSEWTQVAGVQPPGVLLGAPPADTLILAESITQHGSVNPAPGYDSAGTYTVGTGKVGGRSIWNYDFYINSSQNDLANYTFTLTELNVANGQTVTYDPTSVLLGDVGGPSSAGNSESLDFGFANPPGFGYDANADDTYVFTLNASFNALHGGGFIGSDSVTAVVGNGAAAAPDAASTVWLMGAVVPMLMIGKRHLKKQS